MMSHCLVCKKDLEAPCVWEVKRRGFMDSEARETSVFHIDVPDMPMCPNFAGAELSEEVLVQVPELRQLDFEATARAFGKLTAEG